MNLPELQKKLLSVARKNPPSDRVPFAFEKRIMAHLPKPIADIWAQWGHALGRAAATCVIAVALLGGWSLHSDSKETTDLSQEFEQTVFAALDDTSSLSFNEETW